MKFSAPESTDTWFDPQTQLHDTQKSKYLSLTFTVLVLNLSRRWTMFDFMLEWRRGDVLSAASHDSSGDTKENNLCRQFLQLFTQTTLIFTFCLIIFSFYALCQIKTKVINNIVVKKYRFFSVCHFFKLLDINFETEDLNSESFLSPDGPNSESETQNALFKSRVKGSNWSGAAAVTRRLLMLDSVHDVNTFLNVSEQLRSRFEP